MSTYRRTVARREYFGPWPLIIWAAAAGSLLYWIWPLILISAAVIGIVWTVRTVSIRTTARRAESARLAQALATPAPGYRGSAYRGM